MKDTTFELLFKLALASVYFMIFASFGLLFGNAVLGGLVGTITALFIISFGYQKT